MLLAANQFAGFLCAAVSAVCVIYGRNRRMAAGMLVCALFPAIGFHKPFLEHMGDHYIRFIPVVSWAIAEAIWISAFVRAEYAQKKSMPDKKIVLDSSRFGCSVTK